MDTDTGSHIKGQWDGAMWTHGWGKIASKAYVGGCVWLSNVHRGCSDNAWVGETADYNSAKSMLTVVTIFWCAWTLNRFPCWCGKAMSRSQTCNTRVFEHTPDSTVLLCGKNWGKNAVDAACIKLFLLLVHKTAPTVFLLTLVYCGDLA